MKTIFSILILAILISVPFGGVSAQEDEITLFLSFIPSVQFAPVYVAIENGYFAEEGVEVELEHSFNEADGVDRIAVNDLQFGIISGEQVIVARGAGKPLVYVYEWFHDFPVGIVAPADAGISEAADLVDKKVGIPGPFGASYMGFNAYLAANDLSEDDITLESIGFTAPESVCQGVVEAAVVYVTNEPLTIEENCFEVNVISISDYANLVSNGLVTNEETIANDPDLVAGIVRAIRRGVEFTLEDPDAAFEISVEGYVLDLPEEEYETQRQVLENSLALWQSDNLGFTDPERWEETQNIMLQIEFISAPLDDLEASYSNAFVPEDDDE